MLIISWRPKSNLDSLRLCASVGHSGKNLDSNFELYPIPLTIPINQHIRTWSHGFLLP